MQVDQDQTKNGEMKIEEEPTTEVQSDEMMKTTISSEKEKEEGPPLSHAERIKKLHNTRV